MAIGNFTTDFADWRDYTVTYYPFSSYDAHGAPVYGASSSKGCYIEMSPKMIQAHTGQQVVSAARVYLVGNSAYTPKDKFVLPDGQFPPVLRVDHFYNDVATLEMSVVYL
jgi:hypothetical protein